MMKSRLVGLAALAVLAAVGETCFAQRDPGFQRYQVILVRKPFGSKPETPPAPTNPPPAQPTRTDLVFANDIRVCFVMLKPEGGVQVGLVHDREKWNVMLNVGESYNDITLVEADYANEKALLERKGVKKWVDAGRGSRVAAPVPTPVPSSRGRTWPSRSSSRRSRSTRSSSSTDTRTRTPVTRRREATKPALTGEELKKHLEEYQMELIRNPEKGPPLPMRLTKEMDDQLVSEGVLPPLE